MKVNQIERLKDVPAAVAPDLVSVQVTLTRKEAIALCAVLGRVGGATEGPRGTLAVVLSGLKEVLGVESPHFSLGDKLIVGACDSLVMQDTWPRGF